MPARLPDGKAMKNSYSARIDKGAATDELTIQRGYPIRIGIPIFIDANIHFSQKGMNAATEHFRLALFAQYGRLSELQGVHDSWSSN
jgi:hypothetical protein